MRLVSVIVPCFNQAQYLGEALQSVLAQTYTNWECIIVDDGSPDNTERVASKFVKLDNRIKYHKKQNGGLADARNYGINKAKGEFILPLFYRLMLMTR
jgi:glycosyltransferase involved in cell wall biosynthesis